MGWLTATSGNAFYLAGAGIVAMVRAKLGEWWAFDLTEEQWPEIYTTYSPLLIGVFGSKDAAVRAVELRFAGGSNETA